MLLTIFKLFSLDPNTLFANIINALEASLMIAADKSKGVPK